MNKGRKRGKIKIHQLRFYLVARWLGTIFVCGTKLGTIVQKKINEASGKETTGKGIVNVVHKCNSLVQTTNKYALLEEGEVEEENQRKNEAVLNGEFKENTEASKTRS